MGGPPRWVGQAPGGAGLWLGVDLAADGTGVFLVVAARHDGQFTLPAVIETLAAGCLAAAVAVPAAPAEYAAYAARLTEAGSHYQTLTARHNAGHPERTQP